MDFIYIKYKYTTSTCMQQHLHDKPIQLIDICVCTVEICLSRYRSN